MKKSVFVIDRESTHYAVRFTGADGRNETRRPMRIPAWAREVEIIEETHVTGGQGDGSE